MRDSCVVDVKFKKPLKNPVTLDEMKKQKKFQKWELITNFSIICYACSKRHMGYNSKDVSKITENNRFIDIVHRFNSLYGNSLCFNKL